MYKVNINGREIETNIKAENGKWKGTIGNTPIDADLVKISDRQFHLVHKHQSYTIDLIKVEAAEKSMVLRINGHKQTLRLQDQFDVLLKQLGLDNLAAKKVNDLKAPMPGKVLNIMVLEGQEIKKGDALIVLEAMKMENVLKSPCDGVIKKIIISTQAVVEKNQLLIQF